MPADTTTRICHLSTVHWAIDTRILFKECQSLATRYHVDLYAPHHSAETIGGVNVIPLQKFKNKLGRLLIAPFIALSKIVRGNYQVVHFHDPELIPAGFLLRLLGYKVIFDVHENIYQQIRMKKWLPFKGLFRAVFSILNWLSCKAFWIILAEDSYLPIYQRLGASTTTVLNMPKIDMLGQFKMESRPGDPNFLYVGSITRQRGIGTIIKALSKMRSQYPDLQFHCVGHCGEEYREELSALTKKLGFEQQIKFYGKLPIDEAYQVSMKSSVALAILEPEPNYVESYPTKLFEYMAVQLPLITSNFDLYVRIIEDDDVGYCVDPCDVDAVAEKMTHVLENYDEAMQKARRGAQVVQQKYRWKVEENKLFDLYSKITGSPSDSELK